MIEGYFLTGANDETLLVLRSEDPESILKVITRLAASRDKEIKGLAQKLELLWYEQEYIERKNESRNISGNAGPKDSSPSKNSRKY
jgi:hypothetical protein